MHMHHYVAYLPLIIVFCRHAAAPQLYTLSLHDALPICSPPRLRTNIITNITRPKTIPTSAITAPSAPCRRPTGTSCLDRKSHTSELQSRSDLVCRLLLEKKKAS